MDTTTIFLTTSDTKMFGSLLSRATAASSAQERIVSWWREEPGVLSNA